MRACVRVCVCVCVCVCSDVFVAVSERELRQDPAALVSGLRLTLHEWQRHTHTQTHTQSHTKKQLCVRVAALNLSELDAGVNSNSLILERAFAKSHALEQLLTRLYAACLCTQVSPHPSLCMSCRV